MFKGLPLLWKKRDKQKAKQKQKHEVATKNPCPLGILKINQSSRREEAGRTTLAHKWLMVAAVLY